MSPLTALLRRHGPVQTIDRQLTADSLPVFAVRPFSPLQRRMVESWGFPRILDVDQHQKDGFPDAPLAAHGSRYQLLQMLSLRDPHDVVWLMDNHATPYMYRTSPQVQQPQRLALSPQPAASPYNVQQWHQAAYAGVPEIGQGPGTMLIRPGTVRSDFAD